MKAVIGVYAYIEGLSHTPGGVESQSSLFVKYLSQQGHKVIVHCLLNKYGGFTLGEDCIVFGKDQVFYHSEFVEYRPAPGPGIEGIVNRNIQFSKENNENVIIAFGTRDGFVFDVASKCSKELGIPYIPIIYFSEEERRVRSQFGNFTRSIPNYLSKDEQEITYNEGIGVIRQALQEASRVIVPTHYIRAQVGMLCRPEDTYKIRVAYHGVDPKTFKHFEGKKGNSIIQVSRLNIPFAIQKNSIWFLETIKTMISNNLVDKDTIIKIIGPGNGVELFNEYVKKFNLKQVQIKGYMPQDQLAKEIASSKVLFAPSMMEAGTTILVEAALSGTLPLALDYAGSGEILENLGCKDLGIRPVNYDFDEDKTIATVVPDASHFMEIFERIMKDEQWVEILTRNAYERAMEKFTINATGKQMIDIIEEVL